MCGALRQDWYSEPSESDSEHGDADHVLGDKLRDALETLMRHTGALTRLLERASQVIAPAALSDNESQQDDRSEQDQWLHHSQNVHA